MGAADQPRKLLDEIQNEGTVHQSLVRQVEAITGKALFLFFTNMDHPISGIMPHDATFLEQAFRSGSPDHLRQGIDLVIQSPGGILPAADRLVNVCRAFSPTGKWRVIVVDQAMSAATLVAMAADDLMMTSTAQLGPIDPQIILTRGQKQSLTAAITFIRSYEALVTKVNNAIKANQPPHAYVEMLKQHDPVSVQQCYDAREQGAKCAKRYLASGLMKGRTTDEIDRVVAKFMSIGEDHGHAQPIGPAEVKQHGLDRVETLQTGTQLDQLLWELHTRANLYVQAKRLVRYLVWRDAGLNINVQIASA